MHPMCLEMELKEVKKNTVCKFRQPRNNNCGIILNKIVENAILS